MGELKPAEWYDEIFANGKYWNEWVEQFYPLIDGICDLVKEGGYDRILDLGCGIGLLPRRLNQGYKFEYLGIDFSQVGVEKVKKMGFQAEMMDLSQETPDFTGVDIVILSEILEHLVDDLGLVEKIPPGTEIIASFPTFDDESHLRHYSNMSQIINRYWHLVDIKHMDTIQRWILIKGTRR